MDRSAHETVRDKFPEVFYAQVGHIIDLFNVVQLAVTAMAGYHNHAGACGFDLLHFPPAVINAFLVVTAGQCASPAAAANLVETVGMQIHPVFDALSQNPAGFFEKAVTEPLERPAPVIARIVVGGALSETALVELYAPVFNIVDQ